MSLQRRWYEEVWNQGNEAAIDELAAPDVIAHGLTDADGKEVVGTEAFKTLFRAFRSALTDLHVDVQDSIQQGDMSAARCVVTASHTGEGLGIVAKGNRVTFTGMTMCREKDGRLVESWNHFDFATMYQQMQ